MDSDLVFRCRAPEERNKMLWDFIGSFDKTVINWWRVGTIVEDSEAMIGLGAPELRNLGSNIGGKYFVTNDKNQSRSVGIFNACGGSVPKEMDHIVITNVLASDLQLEIGDPIIVTREIDEKGTLRFMASKGNIPNSKIWKSGDSIGGLDWGEIPGPVVAMAIEIDDMSEVGNYVGLSAMFLDNIYGKKGKIFGYMPVQIEFKDQKIMSNTYNAGGMQSVPGCGVRISKSLAETLGLEMGDIIHISYVEKELTEKDRLRLMASKGQIPKEKIWKSGGSVGGMGWGEKTVPIMGLAIEVDDTPVHYIGLTAMFLDNIYRDESAAFGYPPVLIEFGDLKAISNVYNAFGMQSVPGCGIRFSNALAETLCLKMGDVVHISRVPKDMSAEEVANLMIPKRIIDENK